MRGKILKNSLMLSLIVSILLTFAVMPAFAPTTTIMRLPYVVNPLRGPGDTFSIDILIDDVVDLENFTISISYNTDVLTATGYSPMANTPMMFYIDPAVPQGVDDEAGVVYFGAFRWLFPPFDEIYESIGYPYWPGYSTTLLVPIGMVEFEVDSRGTSDLILDAVLTDAYGNTISHVEIDGWFDNRLEGYLAAPIYYDEYLMPGDYFSIEISVDDVTRLWGYQFILSYDTNVLTCIDYENLGIFTIPGPSEINDAMGYMAMSASSYMGDPFGLTTTEPVAIARIGFMLDAEGWSALDLHDISLANVYGNSLVVEVTDGGFASVSVIDLHKRAAWPETHNFKQSQEPDMINTLYGRVMSNSTGAPILFQVVFTAYDEEGGSYLGTLASTPQMIPELTDMTVTADFDTTDPMWGTSSYHVFLEAQVHYDLNGDGVMDSCGHRIKPVNFNVKP